MFPRPLPPISMLFLFWKFFFLQLRGKCLDTPQQVQNQSDKAKCKLENKTALKMGEGAGIFFWPIFIAKYYVRDCLTPNFIKRRGKIEKWTPQSVKSGFLVSNYIYTMISSCHVHIGRNVKKWTKEPNTSLQFYTMNVWQMTVCTDFFVNKV